MRYDISKATAPAMPNLGKGTECIKLRTPGSDVFPRSWRTHERRGISVSRQQLEGADGYDGQSGGKKW